LRVFNHAIVSSRSGKSVMFKVVMDDRFGQRAVNLSSVSGWRATIAKKYLDLSGEQWENEVVQKFVAINAPKAARSKYEALQFLEKVKSLGDAEMHFWASKFLVNERTAKAWRAFYRGA